MLADADARDLTDLDGQLGIGRLADQRRKIDHQPERVLEHELTGVADPSVRQQLDHHTSALGLRSYLEQSRRLGASVARRRLSVVRQHFDLGRLDREFRLAARPDRGSGPRIIAGDLELTLRSDPDLESLLQRDDLVARRRGKRELHPCALVTGRVLERCHGDLFDGAVVHCDCVRDLSRSRLREIHDDARRVVLLERGIDGLHDPEQAHDRGSAFVLDLELGDHRALGCRGRLWSRSRCARAEYGQ